MADSKIRAVLLDVLARQRPQSQTDGSLQSSTILRETADVLGIPTPPRIE